MALPVNFKDDVLASSMDGKRRYNMITNSDGTVSFEDVTTYSQEGSNFGSAQINNTNGAINKINNNVLDTIEEISANTSGGKFAGALALKNVNNSLGGLKFGKDGDGNYGYYGADGSLIPFNRVSTGTFTMSSSGSTVQFGFKPKTVFVFNFSSSGPPLKMAYHSDDTPLNGFYNAISQSGGIANGQAITPIDNGFTVTKFSNWVVGTCYYYAW